MAGPLALPAAVKDLGELAERLDGQEMFERAVDDTANGRIRLGGYNGVAETRIKPREIRIGSG